jgi:ABC-type dipeptide/oligopeptide/nickel transport system permease subunit
VTAATAAWDAVPRKRSLALPAKWRNPVGIVGFAIVVFMILLALLGPYLWTKSPYAPIYDSFQGPSWAHPMGTDNLGRDTFARVIAGARISLSIGFAASFLALFFGALFGLIAGFYKRGPDLFLMRIVDILFAIPGLIMAFLIVGLLGPSEFNEIIAIAIIIMPALARVTRAATLEVMGNPYIESSHALGANHRRQIARHVLPNIMAPLIVLTTLYISQAIIAEATLSFLGLGTQPPHAAWGNMLAVARGFIDSSVWMSVWPGLAIFITVLGFNFLGDGLRDVLDPRIGTDLGSAAVVDKKTE